MEKLKGEQYITVDVEGDRRRAIESLEKVLCKEEWYIGISEICIGIFKQLDNTLNDKQKQLLYEYEEATANKERLLIDRISGV